MIPVWPFRLVIILVAGGSLSGFLFSFVYILKGVFLTREVQKVYKQNGSKWPFWTCRRRQLFMIFYPEGILDEEPGIAYNQKLAVVTHRRMSNQIFLWSCSLSAGGFLAGLILLLSLKLVYG